LKLFNELASIHDTATREMQSGSNGYRMKYTPRIT
jgi:hypothetical protein